jgi:vancomycin resistance protein YoaR
MADVDGSLGAQVDDGTLGAYLGESFAELHVDPVNAGFTLGAAGVEITPDAQGQTCCATDSFDRIRTALDGQAGSAALDLEILTPARDLARAQQMGIIEPVASFTTNHAAGQPRVNNIHRIADIVRGAVIEPGQTFSLNDYVGQRTTGNGFVEAGVIYQGVYEEDVGGGVSQFTTTLFNAAFFGGLEFEEYQSHSIYISRYPYGREATLSYPHPDLRITNNTPYGIMIWPTYGASSISVTLYSTKYIDAQQTGQSERADGRCTRVTTERTRTWPDGKQEVDSVTARYRPGEGVDC